MTHQIARRTSRARAAIGIASLLLAGAILLPSLGDAKVKSFRYGVAAGEITHNTAKIWAAAKGEGKVTAEVAKDKKLTKVVEHEGVKANDNRDGTVQTTIRRLKPDTTYYYRFCGKNGKPCSDRGEFTTAPKSSKSKAIEFAYSGDTDGTPGPGTGKKPFFGSFEAYKAMRKEGNDFNFNFGDTIYSDSDLDGSPPALTVKEKWGKYRQNLSQKNLAKLRGSTGIYSHWDDHEFINDFSIPEDGEKLYAAGVDAFTDYAPVRFDEDDGLYRTFRWGKNLEIFMLDERSFRSASAAASGVCDNPQTGSPDLAPTAPPAKRELFGTLIPSLKAPVSEACLAAINDPQRTMLGQRQQQLFLNEVASSDARWKVVMNETPIQQFYGLPYDRWEGFAYERVLLLNALEQRSVKNLVFLTTDTHADFANVVRTRTFADDSAPANAPAAPHDTPYDDYIAGPVATNPFFDEIDSTVDSPGAGELIAQAFFKPAPPDGVGMFCAQGDVFSYAQVKVESDRLTVSYKDEKGDPVVDVNGEPCGPYELPAQ